MKSIIQFILKLLAKLILKKYKPEIIGITGSVGKTSTKLAVKIVLADKFKVRASPKNYNTEIGVPLTIIDNKNPGHSIMGWCNVFSAALKLIIFTDKDYPQILILEMAADHPGDIKYLVDFIRPKIGIITSVGASHLEFFNTIENVAQEKSNMVINLPQQSYAIINSDQELLVNLSKKVKAKLITFGLNQADIMAKDIIINQQHGGLSFILKYQQESSKVVIPNLLGRPAIYSLLAAASVGLIYNLTLTEITKKLIYYNPPPGRLNLLPGIKYTQLIDDSYNSSPLAVTAALETLSHLKCTGDKYAVLGDMLELGEHTIKAHQEVGQEVARLEIDYLITVGQASHDIALAAQDYGMNPDRIFSFDNSIEAGKFIQDKIAEGDLILIKGSAAMAMEKIVKEIMAEPERAGELLVRQEK